MVKKSTFNPIGGVGGCFHTFQRNFTVQLGNGVQMQRGFNIQSTIDNACHFVFQFGTANQDRHARGVVPFAARSSNHLQKFIPGVFHETTFRVPLHIQDHDQMGGQIDPHGHGRGATQHQKITAFERTFNQFTVGRAQPRVVKGRATFHMAFQGRVGDVLGQLMQPCFVFLVHAQKQQKKQTWKGSNVNTHG
jgi:ribosomal protein L21E